MVPGLGVLSAGSGVRGTGTDGVAAILTSASTRGAVRSAGDGDGEQVGDVVAGQRDQLH